MSAEFFRVYGYLARNWYDHEYGKIAPTDRWYLPAMLLLEGMMAEMEPTK